MKSGRWKWGAACSRVELVAATTTAVLAVLGLASNLTGASLAAAGGASVARATLSGSVVSGGRPVAGLAITLYATGGSREPRILGHATSQIDGSFTIAFRPDLRNEQIAYLLAKRGSMTRVASVLGAPQLPRRVVLNERTTVAAGFALAQFISGDRIVGKSPGLQNAAAMVGDLVDVRSGRLSPVLATAPNGGETSTMREFNSLANMAVSCTRSNAGCGRLLTLATPRGGARPAGALAAFADVARNPSNNVGRLFRLSQSAARPYQPDLGRSQGPEAWTVALRFVGDGRTMNGPGNMAIDARGDVWSTDNYEYSRNPLAPVCGGKLLLGFSPTGHYLPGSPFPGGGLDGAGFGITLDPRGHVWLGNFGFAAASCGHSPSMTASRSSQPPARRCRLQPRVGRLGASPRATSPGRRARFRTARGTSGSPTVATTA